ncbi:hypothetical protein GN956_G21822 [Arapaima gigas]
MLSHSTREVETGLTAPGTPFEPEPEQQGVRTRATQVSVDGGLMFTVFSIPGVWQASAQQLYPNAASDGIRSPRYGSSVTDNSTKAQREREMKMEMRFC